MSNDEKNCKGPGCTNPECGNRVAAGDEKIRVIGMELMDEAHVSKRGASFSSSGHALSVPQSGPVHVDVAVDGADKSVGFVGGEPMQFVPAPVAKIVAGALYEFMGRLTSGKTRYCFSSSDDVAPAIEAITEFAISRALPLNEAAVADWRDQAFQLHEKDGDLRQVAYAAGFNDVVLVGSDVPGIEEIIAAMKAMRDFNPEPDPQSGQGKWRADAASFSRNSDYYRGLLVAIGSQLGEAAKVADDGSVADDVLVSKVPELVIDLLDAAKKLAFMVRSSRIKVVDDAELAYQLDRLESIVKGSVVDPSHARKVHEDLAKANDRIRALEAQLQDKPLDLNNSKITVTMTGRQVQRVLDMAAPDRETDADQLDTEVSLVYGDGHSGIGLYCYATDYPDEGAYLITDDEDLESTVESKKRQAVALGAAAYDELKKVRDWVEKREGQLEKLKDTGQSHTMIEKAETLDMLNGAIFNAAKNMKGGV